MGCPQIGAPFAGFPNTQVASLIACLFEFDRQSFVSSFRSRNIGPDIIFRVGQNFVSFTNKKKFSVRSGQFLYISHRGDYSSKIILPSVEGCWQRSTVSTVSWLHSCMMIIFYTNAGMILKRTLLF